MRIFENYFNSRKSKIIKYRYFLMGQVEAVAEGPVGVLLEALDADFYHNHFLSEVAVGRFLLAVFHFQASDFSSGNKFIPI